MSNKRVRKQARYVDVSETDSENELPRNRSAKKIARNSIDTLFGSDTDSDAELFVCPFKDSKKRDSPDQALEENATNETISNENKSTCAPENETGEKETGKNDAVGGLLELANCDASSNGKSPVSNKNAIASMARSNVENHSSNDSKNVTEKVDKLCVLGDVSNNVIHPNETENVGSHRKPPLKKRQVDEVQYKENACSSSMGGDIKLKASKKKKRPKGVEKSHEPTSVTVKGSKSKSSKNKTCKSSVPADTTMKSVLETMGGDCPAELVLAEAGTKPKERSQRQQNEYQDCGDTNIEHTPECQEKVGNVVPNDQFAHKGGDSTENKLIMSIQDVDNNMVDSKPKSDTELCNVQSSRKGGSTTEKKRKVTFQDQILRVLFNSCKPFNLKSLAEVTSCASSSALEFTLMSLLDKKLVMKKDFPGKRGEPKTLYWANLDMLRHKDAVLSLGEPCNAQDLADTEKDNITLMQKLNATEEAVNMLESQPTCANIDEQLQALETSLLILQNKIQIAKNFKTEKTTQKPTNPDMLKRQINFYRDEWNKRKQKAMDFVENMADAMEKKVKDVHNLLGIETDEMMKVKMPSRYTVEDLKRKKC